MKLSVSALNGLKIVRIAGAVNGHAAGDLCDSLVQCIVEGCKGLIVDLSDATRVTKAGSRGFVVAARLMKHHRGVMRICGAEKPVEGFLRGLGYDHLLKLDPTLETSVAVLSDRTERPDDDRPT